MIFVPVNFFALTFHVFLFIFPSPADIYLTLLSILLIFPYCCYYLFSLLLSIIITLLFILWLLSTDIVITITVIVLFMAMMFTAMIIINQLKTNILHHIETILCYANQLTGIWSGTLVVNGLIWFLLITTAIIIVIVFFIITAITFLVTNYFYYFLILFSFLSNSYTQSTFCWTLYRLDFSFIEGLQMEITLFAGVLCYHCHIYTFCFTNR